MLSCRDLQLLFTKAPSMTFDFIVVGQGLCGTLLSRQLIKAGKTVMVIDDGSASAAGRVAGGIVNPVTGKRLVRTWLIDELLPFALKEYRQIEKELNTSILTSCNILDFHFTRDDQAAFDEKMLTEQEYLHNTDEEAEWQQYFRFNYGIGAINPCLLINLHKLLEVWQHHLISQNRLIQENFDIDLLRIENGGVQYKGISAKQIIFCDGASSVEHPYFCMLPWSKDKGEALIVSIPGLPRNSIYKQHISIVPWKDDLFWVGASHDWKYTTESPTPEFRKRVTEQLDYWLKLPYQVVDHLAALRPANFDRKPFIGFHPVHTQVGIFNGMGGKGCSLAPYFAQQFCGHIVNDTPLMPDVDIRRYAKVLSSQ